MGRRSGDRPSPAPARGARQRCNHAIGHRGVGDLRQLLGGPPAGPGGLALCSTSEALPRRSQGPSPSLCSVRACGLRAVAAPSGKHWSERGDESAGRGGGAKATCRLRRSGPAASVGRAVPPLQAGSPPSHARGLRGCARAGCCLLARDGCSKPSPEVSSES